MLGLRFRRTLKIIPGVRLNISLGGPSVSFGPRGLHYTVGLRGTRLTAGIPGSGLSWTKYQRYPSQSPSGQPPQLPPSEVPHGTDGPPSEAQGVETFESSSVEELVAGSTSELTPILNAARGQIRIHIVVLALLFIIFAVEFGSNADPAVLGATSILGIIAWPIAWFFDQHRLTMTLDYSLEPGQRERFTDLTNAFQKLVECRRVWRVPAEWAESDWKRHAGSSTTLQREDVHGSFGTPSLIKSNLAFPYLPLKGKKLFFAPDAILVASGSSIAALKYEDVEFLNSAIRFIEDGQAPDDAQTVGSTWRYVNKNGTPDRRFANNRELPICLYGQVDFRSAGGLNERFHSSRVEAASDFVTRLIALRQKPDLEHVESPKIAATYPKNGSVPTTKQSGEDVTVAFANESEIARNLALNHGKFWEFLLADELIKTRLASLKYQHDKLEDKLAATPKRPCSSAEFIALLNAKTSSMTSALSGISSSINKYVVEAMGKPGMSGDSVRILTAVDDLFDNCRSFLAVELEMRTTEPPPILMTCRDDYRDIASWAVGIAELFARNWSSAVEQIREGSHQFNAQIKIETPPQLAKI